MTQVFVSGAFDDTRSREIRFLQEAARLGPVTVGLWSDGLVEHVNGSCKFPFDERRYLLESIRFVDAVVPQSGFGVALPAGQASDTPPFFAAVTGEVTEETAEFCRRNGVRLVLMPPEQLEGFPLPSFDPHVDDRRKRVVVTGSFDWFHSGHVRFFEECSALGDVYAVVGHDDNIRLLKGEGHPLLCQDERTYMVASCRYVKRATISSGHGWMDAEPEIAFIRPHIYAVNEDGDKPEKRAFCAEHGIEYVVLKRTPKDGLPRRSSTDLRGY
jgi:cytidyltransferase-like protein